MKFNRNAKKPWHEVPKGEYVAHFAGVELLEPKPGREPLMGHDGKPMPPGMAWKFFIVEGPHHGQCPIRITGREPTPRNACGKMLKAVTGLVLKDGMVVELVSAPFINRKLRITVAVKEHGNGTYVSEEGITPL